MTLTHYEARCTKCNLVVRIRAENETPIKLLCSSCNQLLIETKVYRGFVYLLSNPAMPGLVKIGFTERDVYKRAAELSTTGVPDRFYVHCFYVSEDPATDEEAIHFALSECRDKTNREFFRLSPSEAVKKLGEILKRGPALINDGTNPPFNPQSGDSLKPVKRWIEWLLPES